MKSHHIKQVLLLIALSVLLLTGCKLPGERKTQTTVTPDALALSSSPTPTASSFGSATPLVVTFPSLAFSSTSTLEVMPTTTPTETIISMPTITQFNNTAIVPENTAVPQNTAIVLQNTVVPQDTVIVPQNTAVPLVIIVPDLVIIPQDTAIVPPEGEIITHKTPTPCSYCTDD